MQSSGVICEFNPFHNGHAYLLSRMREQVGEDGCVICLMSGRFVQRGEPSVADPYLRAKTALAGGADLVLELPFPWSASSAEHFATAGVRILSQLDADTLTFGSECGNPDLLFRAADTVSSPLFGDLYAELCRRGIGTTAAYAEAIRQSADNSDLSLPSGFPSSNDLLGIAYIRALHQFTASRGWAPSPTIVTRLGSGYREDTLTEGAYPSATALRLLIREASCDPIALKEILTDTMPSVSLALLLSAIQYNEMPLDTGRLMPIYHALYRLKRASDMEKFAEWGGGLAGHICRHARSASTADEFFSSLRTKQYTDARLKRALLFGMLGVTEEDLRTAPTHTTLLAANLRGCAYLKAWHKKHRDENFTIVTKPADAPNGRERELGELADGLFTLCYPEPREAGDLLRRKPWIHGVSG